MNQTEREINAIINDLDKNLNEQESFLELDYYNDCIDLIKHEIGYIKDV